MKFNEYIKSECLRFLIMLLMSLISLIIFFLIRIPITQLILLFFIFIFSEIIFIIVDFFIKSRRIKRLESILNSLDDKYLAGELIGEPDDANQRYYFTVIKAISRSAIAVAEKERREKNEYIEFIESWIHEIKTPLTACTLMLDNGTDPKSMRRELKKADNYIETILYYARLRSGGRASVLSRFDSKEVINEALKDQKLLLIAAGISVELKGSFYIYSDIKSIRYIISQCLVNCSKYCKGCHIEIISEENTIRIKDNGPGIPSHEIKRITDRGYSGKNISNEITSTGMGLYIVQSICRNLDIDFLIESVVDEYTQISFKFRNLT